MPPSAVDPDRQGARLWETRVGEGGSMGGVQWGSAADQQNVYVALSDLGRVMLTYTQFTDADRQRAQMPPASLEAANQ